MKSLAVLGALFLPGTFVAVSGSFSSVNRYGFDNSLFTTDAFLPRKPKRIAVVDVLGHHHPFDVGSAGNLDILDVLAE